MINLKNSIDKCNKWFDEKVKENPKIESVIGITLSGIFIVLSYFIQGDYYHIGNIYVHKYIIRTGLIGLLTIFVFTLVFTGKRSNK